MESLIDSAGQYGALGMTLLAAFWYINKKDSEYKDERISRDQILQELHEKCLDAMGKNTQALTELSTIIRGK